MTTKINIDVQYMPNDQVNVLIAWPQPDNIKGCPMGRGTTRTTAIRDLTDRVEMESGVLIEINRIKMSDDEIYSLLHSEHFDNNIWDKVDYIIDTGTINNHKRYDLLSMYDSINQGDTQHEI